MLRALLNLGLGVSVLVGGAMTAQASMGSGDAFPNRSQLAREISAGHVGAPALEQVQAQAGISAVSSAWLRNQDRVQLQRHNQVRDVTATQVREQDQLCRTNCGQLQSQDHSRWRTSGGQSWSRP